MKTLQTALLLLLPVVLHAGEQHLPDAPATADGSGHYWVRFSFGGRLDDKTKNAILDAIPKTVFQPGPPSSGEEPVHPNTDPTSGAIGASR